MPARKLDEFFYELGYRLGPGTEQKIGRYVQGLKRTGAAGTAAGKDLDRLAHASERSGRAFDRLKRRVTAVLAALGGFFIVKRLATAFLDAADSSEQYKLRLTALLRSQEEGNRLFKQAAEYASQVPFEYRDIMGAATNLAGVVRGGADAVMEYLPLIGDLAAVTGLTFQETSEQIQRMVSAGAAAADRFRERGTLAMLGFQAGVSYTAEETRRRLFEEWQKADSQFKDAAASLGRTWRGLMSMFADRWYAFRNLVAEKGLFDTLKVAADSVLQKLEEMADTGALDRLAEKISEAGIKAVNVFGKVVEGAGKALEAIARYPETAELGVIGYLFFGKKGAILLGGIGFLGERMGELAAAIVAGPVSATEQFDEKIARLEERLSKLDENEKRVVARLEQMANEGKENTAVYGALERTLAAVQAQQAKVEGQLGPLREGYAEARKELEESEEAQGTFSGTLIELGNTIQDLTGDIEELTEEEKKRVDGLGEVTERLTKEQQKLQEDLADAVRKVTLSAAQQQLAALADLREAYKREFGEISAEAERQFRIVEEAAEKALRVEKAEELADRFRSAMEEGLAKINFEAIGIADETERQTFISAQQVLLYEQQLLDARVLLDTARLTTEEEKALRDVMVELVALIRAAAEGQEDAADAAKDHFRNLQTTLSLIRQSVDGALDLARAFGLVNDETANLVRSLEQIGSGVATLAAAIPMGPAGIPGIISGGLGILGGIAGLAGGRPSPVQQALDANTKAIFLLADEMERLAAEMAEEREAMEALVASITDPSKRRYKGLDFGAYVSLTPEEIRQLYLFARQQGLQFPEELLTEAARAGPGERVLVPQEVVDQFAAFIEALLGQEVPEGGAAGTTQAVRRQVSITELQANQLLAYATTGLELDKRRNEILASIQSALTGAPMVKPPAVAGVGPAPVSTGGVSVGPFSIELTVGAGATPEQAIDVSEQLVTEIRRRLGEALAQQQRLLGQRA